MASNFLKSTTTVLLLISALSIATAFILDIDGDPLYNGGQYYIIPQSLGFGAGLTLKSKADSLPCPFYIGRENDETSYGMPVTIASPFKIRNIIPSLLISIVFKGDDNPNICMQPLEWQVIADASTGKSYIATGGSGGAFNPTTTFSIEQIGININMYKIRNAGVSDVGFFEKDGLLGLTDDIPLHVVFRKAFDVLSMKV
ncbi:kunitz-type trypsin inhibitor alpha chain-like [Beta vulgaris subsp. vulgaris]|uniref:kunitz-type trypsin inhibitor alpha chain-like n=1 Tax=Beta vulgaris subsp. vulgaris TaxID=3555 RepID=UPI002036959B|nr:kunitz-type trypsin inhibitor alpha chain-like [Beta vulgaris subsp. vulgaris]